MERRERKVRGSAPRGDDLGKSLVDKVMMKKVSCAMCKLDHQCIYDETNILYLFNPYYDAF